jgi:hypothetical protein
VSLAVSQFLLLDLNRKERRKLEVQANEKLFQVLCKQIVIGSDIIKVAFGFNFGDVIPYLKMKVEKTDPLFREAGNILTIGEYGIWSQTSPELRLKDIYIGGTREERDEYEDARPFPSEELRNRALTNFCELIKKVNSLVIERENKDGINSIVVGGDKLKCRFKMPLGSSKLYMNCIAMDECLRGKGRLVVHDGCGLYSEDNPTIDGYNLFVRGRDAGDDDDEDSYNYETTSSRSRALGTFFNMIAQVNMD